MIIYATVDDLAAGNPPWVATPPGNAGQLLRSASLTVAYACYRSPYTDAPSTADAAVLKDATCAQAAAWVALGLNPDAAGLDFAPVKKSSILGADVEHDTTGQAQARVAAAESLTPLARAILTTAGLIYEPVPVGAPASDPLPSWGRGHTWWEQYTPFRNPLSGEYDRPIFL